MKKLSDYDAHTTEMIKDSQIKQKIEKLKEEIVASDAAIAASTADSQISIRGSSLKAIDMSTKSASAVSTGDGQIDINIYHAGQPEGMSDRDYLKLLQELQAAGAPLTAVNIRNMVKLRGTCIAPVTGTLKRDDVYEWVKPTYRLSKEEKQHARQVIAEYKKENPGYVKYTDAIKTKTGGGYLKTIPEGTLAEYRRMDLLQAKMDNLTIVAAGAAGTIEIPVAQLGHLGERIGVGAGEKMASILPWTDREKLSRGSSQLNAGADQYLNGILQYHYGMHNQNPAAYNAGAIAANVGEIYVCNRVTDQISGVAENGATGAYQGGSETINPQEIRYSQSSVNGSSEIIDSMKKNGWKGDPIDVVEMPDGIYTTIDNTRVASAREAGINVQANVYGYNDALSQEYIERFTTKKGVPVTWGDAISLRIGKQKASFRNGNPFGAFDMDTIK